MLLGDKHIDVEVVVDNPVIQVSDFKEVGIINYILPTENDELLTVPVYLQNLEPLPNILYTLRTVNDEPLIVPITLELFPYNFSIETEDLAPTIMFGSTSLATVFSKAVSGIKTTFAQIATQFTLNRDVAGDINPGTTYYGAISFPTTFTKEVAGSRGVLGQLVAAFTASITTAGVASSPVPAFKAVGAIDSDSGTNNLTPGLPSGWAPGDFALLIGYVDLRTGNSLGTADPSGWTSLVNIAGDDYCGMRVWYRFLQSGDSNPTVDMTGSGSWLSTDSSGAIIATFSNVHTSSPFNATGASNYGGGSPATTSAITTANDDSLLVTLLARGDNEGFSSETYGGSSTGVSELFDAPGTGGDDCEIAAFAKLLASAGSSGAASASTSAVDPWAAYTLALRKA